MHPLAQRVLRKFMAFKYQPKETKQNRVDRLSKTIREATGLSRTMSEEIADAIVRGREVDRLAMQKGWPIEHGTLTGPKGTVDLSKMTREP